MELSEHYSTCTYRISLNRRRGVFLFRRSSWCSVYSRVAFITLDLHVVLQASCNRWLLHKKGTETF